mmetsp:Transcript_95412/g.273644  ORF Transcript_95412/g.273644 Transcript_95412/m.273644 type:complete len:273 (+) Transcript_95412:36-854(+)|eukprot:CAMPEP_0177474690 /NCGR_PEP_ID=MMETSP0369-20130122/22607_1 /TAXON_ID=447022 ORGANISM="Scrippsiella hangoei-like, Strain SHHI-4" /NCGR_SAMPLE_ID=MMETSP0369 /ASSEMBLY_ACC=CAM_ASM_000364 /LENGTH=272 /DNA_ID=CAMNT_0018949709 /DNA_START=30 /DNA_END=848 /DNA_ORIENTATION=-
MQEPTDAGQHSRYQTASSPEGSEPAAHFPDEPRVVLLEAAQRHQCARTAFRPMQGTSHCRLDAHHQAALRLCRLLRCQFCKFHRVVDASDFLALVRVNEGLHELWLVFGILVGVSENSHALEREGPQVPHQTQHPTHRRHTADEVVAMVACHLCVHSVELVAELRVRHSAPSLGDNILELVRQHLAVALLIVPLEEAMDPILGGRHADRLQGPLELLGVQRVAVVFVALPKDALHSIRPVSTLLVPIPHPLLQGAANEGRVLQGQETELPIA